MSRVVTCVFPGCGTRSTDKGRGYCSRHSRNLYRCGHPEGMREKTERDLYVAALEYAGAAEDAEDLELARALALAAVRYAMVRTAYLYVPGEAARAEGLAADLRRPEVRELLRRARAYWDVPDTAPQAVFEERRQELVRWTLDLVKALRLARNPAGLTWTDARRSAARKAGRP